jgi:hypothetical protein
MVSKLTNVTFIKKEGWRALITEPIPVFHILTKTFTNTEWNIQRTYKDFEALRQHLLEWHPDCIVPALPPLPKVTKDADDLEAWNKLGSLIVQFME